jgi:peptidoglycan/xylan/chitin deacetylase (PgdA/CDA1 family)
MAACAALSLTLCTAQDAPAYTITQWWHAKTGALSMTFDDGGAGHATVTVPALKAKGVRGTFFICPGWIGDGKHCSWDQVRAIAADGNEIGSHSMNHGYGEGAEIALKGARDRIDQEVPTQRCVTISYPSGGYHKDAGLYYIAGRMAGKHFYYPHWVVNIIKTEDNIVGGGSAAEMQGIIDECLKQKAWTTLTYHDSGKAFPEQLDLLKANEEALWVAPFGEVARYCKEARAAKVEVKTEAVAVTITLTDDLPDDVFNAPLTLRVKTPAPWATPSAKHGDTPVWCQPDGEYVLVDVVPDRGPVVVAGG